MTTNNHEAKEPLSDQDANLRALVKAARAALAFMVEWDIEQLVVSGLSLQLNAALKPFEEEKP